MADASSEQQRLSTPDTPKKNNDFGNILKNVLSDPNGRAELEYLLKLSSSELIDRKNTYILIAERQEVYKAIEEKSDLMKDRKEYIKWLIFIANRLNSSPSYGEILKSVLNERKIIQQKTNDKMKDLLGDIRKNPPIKKDTPKDIVPKPIIQVTPVIEIKPKEQIIPERETPKIPVLTKYINATNGIIETLNNIQQDRDENTGFVNTLIDDGITLFGKESGKAVYKRSFDSVRESAHSLETSLKKIERSKLSDLEQKEYDSIIQNLTKIKKMEIGDVSVLKSFVSSIKSTPDSINNAIEGALGTIKGIGEGGKGIIEGVANLSIFMLKYSGSWIGINSEYKKEIHIQSGKIWDFLEQEGLTGMSSKVYDILGNEMKKIGELPPKKLAEAIGKISGHVISALLLLKGTLLAGAKVADMGAKMGRIGTLLETLSTKGINTGDKVTKLTEFLSIATKTRNATFAIETLLNGPAEMLIGTAAVKSFGATFALLKARKASEAEFESLSQSIIKEAEKQTKSLEKLFEDHPLKTWFEKEGSRRSEERLNQILKLWQDNIGTFPKEVHTKIASDPEYLEYLMVLGRNNSKEVEKIVEALRIKDSDPFLVFNGHKSGWKDPKITHTQDNPLDDAHGGREPDDLVNNPEEIRDWGAVLKDAQNGDETSQTIIKMGSKKGEKILESTKSIDNINADGALKLNNINLSVLESITDMPRTIEIAQGKYISIIKTSSTKDGKSIFTVRYGIDFPNAKYPAFEGVSIFVVDAKTISFSNPRSQVSNHDFEILQQKLLQQIRNGKDIVENDKPLTTIKKGQISNPEFIKTDFPNAEIIRAGTNEKGQKVLLVNIADKDGIGGQLELNLFEKDGKNIIYFGSMAKDGAQVDITKSLFGLLPRMRDILKEFDSNNKPAYIQFFRAKNGVAGTTTTLTLKKALERFFSANNEVINYILSPIS